MTQQLDRVFQNRSREQIIYQMLQFVDREQSVKKTKIMNHTDVSYAQIKYYLELLSKNELIKEDDGLYETTKLGKSYIDAYKTLDTLLKHR